ncbi:hypothetical protein GR160_13230 [Flavobacterium sp. Sd200]|uniref:hypothetical protein n=1 Tax=Flavobacterium sp. Sd200 TaxID=2692211 RepID=UPI00136FDCBC|nr:hypothetical protein [Flavobacterium sp. Sd200]MXN92188.1 hypothetical protein [Flavobacterium sp. Sd200]
MNPEQIKSTIVGYIAVSTKYPETKIDEEFVLKKWPLALDDISLAFLAISCDKYLKTFNPDKEVFISEIRKRGLTVKGLVDLVVARANS